MTELATLRILRPLRTASPLVLVIEVDGREIGRLRKGQDLVTYVEPGRHILRARGVGKSEPVELVLAPGEDVRLETRLYTKNFWDVFKTLSMVRTDGSVETSGCARPVGSTTAQVLGITEMYRSEEPIGTENLRISNTSGAVRLTRTMRVTREWRRTVNLDVHDTRGSATNIVTGPAWLSLRATIEQSLSRTYTISEDHREEFAEEFSVEVEPGAAVTVVLDWKRLWQHGVVHVLFQGRQIEIPFCVAIGITFDQSVL